jgi:hypothetical protein
MGCHVSGLKAAAQCIYCKRQDVAFNREHCIPKAFGTYGGQTVVLRQHVCVACNSSLSRELDEILARDSFEGLLRAKLLRPKRKRRDRYRSQLTELRYEDDERFGPIRGARLIMDWNTRCPKLLPQIVVRLETGQLQSYVQKELAAVPDGAFQNVAPGSISALSEPEDSQILASMIEQAQSKGANFTKPPEYVALPPTATQPHGKFEIQGVINDRVWRAIARIAFNYLAWVQGIHYVLDDRFDPIRNFIVKPHPTRALVKMRREPILADESYRWRSFQGHLILVETNQRMLIGRVSLFNSITYEVLLCPDIGLYHRLSAGHAFDPITERMTKLTAVPKRITVSSHERVPLKFKDHE